MYMKALIYVHNNFTNEVRTRLTQGLPSDLETHIWKSVPFAINKPSVSLITICYIIFLNLSNFQEGPKNCVKMDLFGGSRPLRLWKL